MATIVINDNTESGRKLMNEMRSIIRKSPDVTVYIFDDTGEEELDTLPFERIPGVPCTQEELREAILLAEAQHDPKKSVPHDVVVKRLKEKMQSWK
ncbi:hypothetical protein [Bacteroides sp. 51]|uniref:hypothetical protein n=1 Tax=Bacteroides sp. 51 TaxID=2302938 RepID=UPI0013D1D716|nr:hypothetical protein [Bacteroides sp. 51]